MVALEPSTPRGCVPGRDRGAPCWEPAPPSPLLIPIFPLVRQQTGIQAPGLTDREFYEQPMSLHPREPPAVSGAACKATRPESVSWGWGSPPSPGLIAQSTGED